MIEDFWIGMMIRVMRWIPGDILDDGSLFDLAGELQHGVERASAGKRDIFDRAHDDQQRVGVEEVELLGGEQDEKCDADGDGRHEVGQEGDGVDVVGPAAAAVFGDGVADHRADGAGQQRAGDGDEDRALEGPPDGLIVQDALLAVQPFSVTFSLVSHHLVVRFEASPV